MRSQYERSPICDGEARKLQRPLQQRSQIEMNQNGLAAIRLVPKTPPRLLGPANEDDEYYYSRTPLPTHPSHILHPNKREKFTSNSQFGIHNSSSISSSSRIAVLHGPIVDQTPVRNARTLAKAESQDQVLTDSNSPRLKPSVRKRQLTIHPDTKTFSLRFPEDNNQAHEEEADLCEKNTFQKPRLKSNICSPWASNQASNFASDGESQNTQGSSAHVTFETSYTPVKDSNDFKTALISNKPNKTILKDLNICTPCDNKFIGGLRTVSETPDHKEEAIPDTHSSSYPQPFENSNSTLPSQQQNYHLPRRLSLSSATSTSSETNNYKVYSDASSCASSPRSLNLPTSDDSFNLSLYHNTPKSAKQKTTNQESNINEVSGSSSQVNLLIQSSKSPKALLPIKLGIFQPTKKSIHTTFNSRKLIKSSTTISPISQEALRTVFSSNELVQGPLHSITYNQNFIGSSSCDGISRFFPPWSHMYEYPHQWSSQLSTVLSVSDENSDLESISWSENSRLSFSSRPRETSVASRSNAQDASRILSAHQSWDSSIELPQASFSPRPRLNSNSSVRMIAQPDEYGDGITDMHNMRIRPLRRRTSTFCSFTSSDNERSNTMKSSVSSNSNMLNLAMIPTWARLYYGNGERRPLRPSRSMNGYDSDSRTDSFRESLQGLERQLSESHRYRKRCRENSQADNISMRNTPQSLSSDLHGLQPMERFVPQPKMIASWSPHLRPNKRIERTCMRGPPSTVFSMEGGLFDRRNIQVVMFIIGFLLPFFWMIASLLPLPPLPLIYMSEDDRTSPSLETFKIDHFYVVEEARYESARWWRKVNRWMSIIGVLLISIAVVLVILGLEQGWMDSTES